MGRGTSKVSGGDTVTSLTIGNDTIDLSDSPLRYGGKDGALSGKARSVIEDFENKRYKQKTEFSRLIDKDGNIIEENRGGRGSVGASLMARTEADVLTHNHPREDGGIGGTFSTGDIHNFNVFNQTTYRAAAKEGTYSITKAKGYDGAGLLKAMKDHDAKSAKTIKKQAETLTNQYMAGKMDRKQYSKGIAKLNNAYLVSTHDFLLDNQKKYGYNYTLERR